MGTIYFDTDVDQLTKELKEMLEEDNAVVLVTNSMHGQMLAGSKKIPLLRTPMAYNTDLLKTKNGIPINAKFFGIMLIPKDLMDETEIAKLKEET